MKPRNAFIALVALIAIAMGTWTSYRLMTPPPAPQTATVFPAATALPEFSLLDQYGNPVGREVFEGQWDLVFFGYTHCPDICPLTMQTLASARRRLAESGQDPLPRIVFVSVDPERDTPDLMRQYVDYFGDGNLGITGEPDEIRKLAGGLGIYYEKTAVVDDTYTVDHSAIVIVVNPRGEFHALFGAPHEVANFVHDLPIIMVQKQ